MKSLFQVGIPIMIICSVGWTQPEPSETSIEKSEDKKAAVNASPVENKKPMKWSIQNLPRIEEQLDKEVEKAGGSANGVPSAYLEAKSCIANIGDLAAEEPDHEFLGVKFTACSLMVRAAKLQLEAHANRRDLNRMHTRRASLNQELQEINEEINRIERGYASNLKMDLEEERRKARQRQEEAANRLDNLQSELINVKKDARGIILSMSDILFDVDKATLTNDLKQALAKIAGILTVYREADVKVEGHTDNQGSEEYNQKLSEARASNVLGFMIEQGIDPNRLTAVGYGFSRPIAENDTKEGRAKNRRVDLVISDKNLQSKN